MILRRMPAPLRMAPEFLRRYVLHFEACIEDALRSFASSLPEDARVLDAGAGEAQYAPLFTGTRYTAVDLGVGDATWAYGELDAVCDLQHLPFHEGTFHGVVNIVTLEHVRHPAAVIRELARVLRPGGRLLLATPLEWEEHQVPHDYFRYTRYGLTHLLESAGLVIERLDPVGGFFRLLARRLFAVPQFFPAPFSCVVLALVTPVALLVPVFDGLDKEKRFTPGHLCTARKGHPERSVSGRVMKIR
jgi:SAM-dependent methyltransferase